MTTEPLHRRLSPEQYAALLDEARAQATRLRNEAIDAALGWLVRQGRRGGAALAAWLRRPQAVARCGGPAR